MKQKLIIGLAVMMLLAIIGLMVWDFYYDSKPEGNPFAYELDNLRKVDQSEICYNLKSKINPEIEAPYGIAVDYKDRVYVAGKDRIKIFDKKGNPVSGFEIFEPAMCISVSPDGDIYLGLKDHIEVFDFSGNFLMQWPQINSSAFITSIAVEGGSVFVADAGNKLVYHFNQSGILKNTIGERNMETGFSGFIIPSPHFDMAIGREGQLWVVNPGKHEFLAFNKNGELFSSWEKTSMQLDGFSGCCNPGNIALLPDGSFVTSEKGIERVKIHLPSGDYKCVVAAPENFEEGTEHLDLAVNSEGDILVLDTKKEMVNIYTKK